MRRLYLLVLFLFLVGSLLACGTTPTPTFVVPTWEPPVPLTFSPAQLPEAQLGQPYSITITVSGNKTPVGGASISQGELPPGMTLNYQGELPPGMNTVEISGIPQQEGKFKFTIDVWCERTMAPGQDGQQDYVVEVNRTATPTEIPWPTQSYVPLVFSPDALPEAQLGQAYSATIAVSGNVTPVGWVSITDGELPPGMTLNYQEGDNTAEVSGVPQQVGEFKFTIYVSCYGTSVDGQDGQQDYVVEVKMAPLSTPLTDLGSFRYVSSMPVGLFTLQAASDGTLYAINREALYRLDGKKWTLVVSDPPAPLLNIDPKGRVWAASSELAAVWENGSWTQYSPGWGWAVDSEPCYNDPDWTPGPALLASDGTVWLAGCRDVRRLYRQNWQIYSLSDMGMFDKSSEADIDRRSFSLAEAEGNIWVAECTYLGPGVGGGTGVRWFDGQAWHGIGTMVSGGCARVAKGPDESLWAVVNANLHPTLYQYDSAADRWSAKPFPAPAGNTDRLGAVTNWIFDTKGDPWIEMEGCGGASCGDGAARYHYLRDSQSFVQVGSDLFYPTGPVVNPSQMLFDSQGEGWLFVGGSSPGEADGIYQLAGEQFELVSAASITSAARTPDFKIWVAGSLDGQGGLWVLEP